MSLTHPHRHRLQALPALTLVSYLAAFGAKSLKPLEFRTSYPSMLASQYVVKSKPFATSCLKCRESVGSQTVQLAAVVKRAGDQGTSRQWRKRVNGKKAALDASKAYPEAFCKAVARLVAAGLQS